LTESSEENSAGSSTREEFEFYTSPWVSGTRAAAYFGPVTAEIFLDDDSILDREEDWMKAERELLEVLRDKAKALGANAVVGFEMTLDPFAYNKETGATGLRLYAVGTSTRLEALF
jgi:hypothetical protein